ncbi:MAG: TlpA family protein disulfide reductase [Candidatus Solibacter usitatus]|nr:TlpA family protein disulfide reductase [Candidatus Solibacter usitatus]
MTMRIAPLFSLLPARADAPSLLFFFETDCPTCRLIAPYLNRLHEAGNVIGISQDSEGATAEFARQTGARFPVVVDRDWEISKAYDPQTVPALFLVSKDRVIEEAVVGFDKASLNHFAARFALAQEIAPEFDGNPASKPGCMSRHLEPIAGGPDAVLLETQPARASRIILDEAEDDYEYCMRAFGDALPVVPPTAARVERMLHGTVLSADALVAKIPPCYGAATVEKVAANAVMAGCEPRLLPVLISLVRAACDERFNLHGIQATTHFAAPLVILNGPLRKELGFTCAGNVFSNVARSNSTLGRAFQLMLTNIGGARPGEIDMSTQGNPGKFSWVIAENEEVSPWEPLHVERGLSAGGNGITLFGGDGVRGVSEHTARRGTVVLKAICATLATVWSWRVCLAPEALVVICPEHAATLRRDGFTKQQVREFLFANTGIPVRAYDDDDGGEGTQLRASYEEVVIGGERCYRKFRTPEAIQIVVAGGTAGKFSSVIGSWATGPRGSQMVTYPVE